MGFREKLLEQFAIRAKKPATKAIDPKRMQAFTRKELEQGINLYLHLKALNHTFEDLREFIELARRQESTERAKTAVKSAYVLTREQRKHARNATRKGLKRRNPNG